MANKNRFHIGFLRVAHSDLGFVGGLLVTNHLGRPLEFQCTTPVRPNKTQEILYGPTLQPFLYSELIGKTLIERLNVKPDVVIVQQESLLDLRREIETPVVCVVTGDHSSDDLPDQVCLQLGSEKVRLHNEFLDDAQKLESAQKVVPGNADLSEPLERVKEALQETLRAGAVA